MARASAWKYILVFFDMTREIVIASASIALLYYRGPLQVHMVLGSVICCYLAKALKLAIRQERPAKEKHGKKSYGMPSTHSAAVVYFGTYLAHTIHNQYGISADPGSLAAKWSLLVLALLACTMAALSRAFNRYHTFAQVFAGMFLGAAFASLWWNTRYATYPYIESMAGILRLQLRLQHQEL